jgi:hypothetical protein
VAAAQKFAGESVSRIWISGLQMHNLRRINERFSFYDLWRRVFLTEDKTSDMFLACFAVSDILQLTPFANYCLPSFFVPAATEPGQIFAR